MTTDPDTRGDNLYAALGVDADATDREITMAYRRLARDHHPDANPAGTSETFAGGTTRDGTCAADASHWSSRYSRMGGFDVPGALTSLSKLRAR